MTVFRVVGFIGALSFATAALADTPPKDPNAFGSTRSYDSSTTFNPSDGGPNTGRANFSQRKGDNAEMNLDFHRDRGGMPTPDLDRKN